VAGLSGFRRFAALWRGFRSAPSPLSRRLAGLFFAVLPLPVRRPALRLSAWCAAFAARRSVRRVARLAWRFALSPVGFAVALLLLARALRVWGWL
jgi:hypothetical protein